MRYSENGLNVMETALRALEHMQRNLKEAIPPWQVSSIDLAIEDLREELHWLMERYERNLGRVPVSHKAIAFDESPEKP